MQFQKSTIIDAPVERVWAEVAHNFAEVGQWSSAVADSGPNPDARVPEGATVGGRVCATPGFGDLKETFTQYSEADTEFTFQVSGMPSFITLAQNHVTVRPAGRDRSEVTLNITLETNAVGKIMGPMFAVKLRQTLNTYLVELTNYIERGEVSKKKAKQLAKLAAATA
ncbi:MAG: SRPBCC family protein [Actinomycetota bacterium]